MCVGVEMHMHVLARERWGEADSERDRQKENNRER